MIGIYQFLSGAAMMGAWAAGVCFFRAWSKAHDRLLLLFGIAFWLMALERMVLIAIDRGENEAHAVVYLIRLVAFLIIISGVIAKNREALKQNESRNQISDSKHPKA